MRGNCTHKGIQKVLTIGACEIHAGSEQEVYRQGHEFDLVISLTGRSGRAPAPPLRFKMSKGSNRLFANIVSYMKARKRDYTLVIDWPDMGLPPVDCAFWEALYQDLFQFKGRAVMHCLGGHGRTGTALTILAHLNNQPAEDMVRFIRDTYCQEAVETQGQMNYLKNVIGVSTASESTIGGASPPPPLALDRYFPKPNGGKAETAPPLEKRGNGEFPAWFASLGNEE